MEGFFEDTVLKHKQTQKQHSICVNYKGKVCRDQVQNRLKLF
jgi:hypothetical protein